MPAARRCSAASVLAKVVRDRLMRDEAPHFPAYQFEENKGYPSSAHKRALRGYGLSAIHRRSWAFVSGIPWSDGAPQADSSGSRLRLPSNMTAPWSTSWLSGPLSPTR